MRLIASQIDTSKCTMEFEGDAEYDSSALQLRKVYLNAKGSGVTEFVLDFQALTVIDSRGLGLLLEMRSNLDENTIIRIINSSAQVKQVLTNLHLGDIFTIE